MISKTMKSAAHKNPTQADSILAYMQEGRKISPLEALELFGCFRLGARIHELKQRGQNIVSELFTNPHGVRFARYWLPQTLKEIVK